MRRTKLVFNCRPLYAKVHHPLLPTGTPKQPLTILCRQFIALCELGATGERGSRHKESFLPHSANAILIPFLVALMFQE